MSYQKANGVHASPCPYAPDMVNSAKSAIYAALVGGANSPVVGPYHGWSSNRSAPVGLAR